jgi:hypothetical protein
VRDGLLSLARELGAVTRFGVTVEGLVPPSAAGEDWRVMLAGGEWIGASAVVLCDGGALGAEHRQRWNRITGSGITGP